jgi:hypothetical protein
LLDSEKWATGPTLLVLKQTGGWTYGILADHFWSFAGNSDPWSNPLNVPGKQGDYVLTHNPDQRKAWIPALYDFTPSDQFDVHGTPTGWDELDRAS